MSAAFAGEYRIDMLDFPTAWAIQRQEELVHHERCSSVPGWDPISGPGLLCDCGAVTKAWEQYVALYGTGSTDAARWSPDTEETP